MKLSEMELWDFVYKEICLVSGMSKFEFAISPEKYNAFRRRFHYFVNKRIKK